MTSVQQNRAPNGDRVITPVLPAGRYVVLASTDGQQVYPGTGTMDVRTVQGSEGTYGVRLTTSAPPPVVTSLALSSATVRGGTSVTGTYTLSRTGPGRRHVRRRHQQSRLERHPGSAFAPAGTTRVSFRVTTRSGSADLRVTLTAWARVGATKDDVLTVRR